MIFPSVQEAFPVATKPLEGCVLSPYLDVFGYATVGYGCLCDTPEAFAAIEWAGNPSPFDIAVAYHSLKSFPKALHWKQYERATTLRMTQAAADKLLDTRAEQFAEYMQTHYFHDWENWPADAQLACLLMSWACGPAYPSTFKTFLSFVVKRDWVNAAKCAKISVQGNAGVIPRNAQVALCLANAAEIDNADDMATPALYWPGHVGEAVKPSTDPALIPLSVQAAVAAEQALARFRFDDDGITGHAHGPVAA